MSGMKPILFNTEMVRAILDGHKTATRRICKLSELDNVNADGSIFGGGDFDNGLFKSVTDYVYYFHLGPYQPGDILYVRETFFKGLLFDQNEDIIDWDLLLYAADEKRKDIDYDNIKWSPSIHMPKEAARIFLRITNVRVERLQDITEDGMIAEGTRDGDKYLAKSPEDPYPEWDDRYGGWIGWNRACFEALWNSTLKEKQTGPLSPYRFCFNPWVWVIEFERCEKPQ